MEELLGRSHQRIDSVSTEFIRGMQEQINWDNRLIGIRGARGVGKTTLLLQQIKTALAGRRVAFINLDDLFFSSNTLIEFAKDFASRGGEYLFIDEVHKYENWSSEIKNAYDYFPSLKIVFTGSSITKILNAKADLSRRAVVYEMQGLSFREYLNLTQGTSLSTIRLDKLLTDHAQLAIDITRKIKPLAHFGNYLRRGYYPFFLEGIEPYWFKINQTIKLTLEIDLNHLDGYNPQFVNKVNKLLFSISSSVPFKPNITKLAERIGMSRGMLTQYFYFLAQAKILNLLHSEKREISFLQKPDMVYLENTNLLHAIAPSNVEPGNIRETFFINQVGYKHMIQYPAKGDFLVEEEYLFEVGGKNKTGKQMGKGQKNYVVADDIEVGSRNKIPLWMFGFLY